jgi:hypothetical protein
MSFLRQLVQATLRPSKRPASHSDGELEVATFSGAAAAGARAVAYGGQGLDLAGGECVLAAIGSHAEPQGFHHRLGVGFLSPLCADDLGHVLCGALGQPLRYEQPQPGMHWLDFRYDPQRDTLSPALAALGIASFFALGIGFSPGRMIAAEMLRKPPLNVIRFAFADVQGGCAYEIYGNGRRIEPVEAELGHALHQLLVHAAWPVLERRCWVA